MCEELLNDIQFWATVASPVIGAIAIIVALCISRRSSRDAQKQIDEIRQSTEKQINGIKDIIAHQGEIEWGHLQHLYFTNEFELTHEENQLAFIRFKQKHMTLFGLLKREQQDLKIQEQILDARIKNRKIMRDNYNELLKGLDKSTNEILFEKVPEPK